MSHYMMPEVKPEKRRYMFWMARIFGRKLTAQAYEWRGKMWIVGEVK